ncbi:putative valine--tRNA ligase [Helianthus annuus]|nr:putative valine--tRNA ligase [Helianthus annuus]
MTLRILSVRSNGSWVSSSNGLISYQHLLGCHVFEARVAVTRALKAKGLYKGEEKNEMRLGICSRSNDVVEPVIKPQWYVNCNGIAKEALDVVMECTYKKSEIMPKQYAAEWRRFKIENGWKKTFCDRKKVGSF